MSGVYCYALFISHLMLFAQQTTKLLKLHIKVCIIIYVYINTRDYIITQSICKIKKTFYIFINHFYGG